MRRSPCADMPSPLPRWDRRRDRVAPRKPATAAFPIPLAGRLPHQLFRGLLGVHVSYGLPARGAASAALSTEGFGSFVSSTTAPIATGWSNSCRAGITPAEDRHLRTAHKGTRLVLNEPRPLYALRTATVCVLEERRVFREFNGTGVPQGVASREAVGPGRRRSRLRRRPDPFISKRGTWSLSR